MIQSDNLIQSQSVHKCAMVNYQLPPQLLIHVSTLVPGMESIAKVIDWTSTEEINTSVNYTVIIFDLIRKWLSYHLFNRHIGKRHFVAWSSCTF